MEVVIVNQCGMLVQMVWLDGALLRLQDLASTMISADHPQWNELRALVENPPQRQ